AFAAGLGAVVAVRFGPPFLGTEGGTPRPAPGDRVARATPSAPADAGSSGQPAAAVADPAAATSAGPAGAPVDSAPVAVAADPTGTPPAEPAPVGVETPVLAFAPDSPALEPGAGDSVPASIADAVAAAGLAAGPVAPDLDAELLRQIAALPPDRLEMIWRGDTAPMEALAAPVRILMPRVGPVRIVMGSEEVFEGRLVAMGQNQVWIDTDLGRMGLEGSRIDRIERLPAEPAGVAAAVQVARGDRVRVRTLGGVLYGRVIVRTGITVTLETEGGGRVVLTDPVIEPLGSSRAILVEQ
ncbi:MAG: hypothetical protein AB1726_08765, partial [Planctomycetota bacterium]